MKIFLDGRIFSQQLAGGISKYWFELLNEMAKISSPSFEKVELYLSQGNEGNIFLKQANPESLFRKHIPQTKSSLSAFLKNVFDTHPEKQNTIVHSPYMIFPDVLRKGINVLTVHDLIHKKQRPSGIRNWLRGKALDISIQWADAYICVSNATLHDLHSFFPETKDKPARVIYHGVNELVKSSTGSKEIKVDHGRYFLFVGKRDGYKNFPAFIQALGRSESLSSATIVCAGGGNFSNEEVEILQKSRVLHRIEHVASPNDEQLASLYACAVALIYPSKFEGFGMPIVEAMAMGCRVICANTSSMLEVSDGLNIGFDLNDPESLRTALELAFSSECTTDQAGKLIEHSRKFTWNNALVQTIEFYDDLIRIENGKFRDR